MLPGSGLSNHPKLSGQRCHAVADERRWKIHPLAEDLKARARAAGLWNLWMPAEMAHTLQPLVRGSTLWTMLGVLLISPPTVRIHSACCA